MNLFSRRDWKRWVYGKFRADEQAAKTNPARTDSQESEYPAWLIACVVLGIIVLIVVYIFWL